MMVVRADLCERLAQLRISAGRSSRRAFSDALGTFRLTAASYGLHPAAHLAEALERAMAEGLRPRFLAAPYLDRMQDAIGCARTDHQASEAMVASILVRLDAA
jgi:hypothetical protein